MFDVLPSIEVLPSQVSTRVVNNSCRPSFALGAATAEKSQNTFFIGGRHYRIGQVTIQCYALEMNTPI